jgi:hypothetical protein
LDGCGRLATLYCGAAYGCMVLACETGTPLGPHLSGHATGGDVLDELHDWLPPYGFVLVIWLHCEVAETGLACVADAG